MKKILPILMAGTLLFSGCGTDTGAGTPAAASPTPEATAEASVEEAAKKLSDEDKDALIQELLENNMKEIGDMKYEIDMSDKEIAILKIWQEGIVEGLNRAQGGDQAAADAWNALRDSLVTMNKDMVDRVKIIGSDRSVCIMLMNDANLENTLLTIMDGTIINDSLQDAAPAEGGETAQGTEAAQN